MISLTPKIFPIFEGNSKQWAEVYVFFTHPIYLDLCHFTCKSETRAESRLFADCLLAARNIRPSWTRVQDCNREYTLDNKLYFVVVATVKEERGGDELSLCSESEDIFSISSSPRPSKTLVKISKTPPPPPPTTAPLAAHDNTLK